MLQAILLSYSIGMNKGLAEASVEDRYPMVDVEEIIIPIRNVFRLIRRP